MLRHDWRPRHLRREGARVLRVAQRPHARAELAGRPGGQLQPGAEGAPHRVLLGLPRALLHVQGREEGAGAAGGARALPGRGEALPPIQEWRRFDAADVQPGLFWCEDLREARRQLMAAGESPKVAISSPAHTAG